MSHDVLARREFLRTAAVTAGAAFIAPGAVGAAPTEDGGAGAGRRGRAGGGLARRSLQDPWGRLERVAPDVWALVSTPLNPGAEARRTLCNGGLVAGREGVLAVEGFASPAGAAWLAGEAERVVGRRPTHVALTHYHGDHTGGTAGYVRGATSPAVLATATTRRLLAEQEARHPADRRRARPLLLPDTVLADDVDETIDLGGRTVRLVGRRGHTPSDLVVETDGVIFAGDLVWIGMFPNYVDAIPQALGEHVRALRDRPADVWVSGHGEIARAVDMDRYIDLLDHVGDAARRAVDAGTPLDRAAADYTVPESLGRWHMFSDRYPEVAFRAWGRALEG